jgi:zinc protease
MSDSVTRCQLPNGLIVLLKEIHTAPIVSQWIWYRAGSRDETPGRTGVSHWCEHMLFKGTAQFRAGELDRLISRDGGYWNAFTFLDWTTYFETMPSDKIDLALRLEADRMANSLFEADEVASERTVIISERQGEENEPLFRLSEEVQAAAFRVHSYHHEIIGDLADLQSMQRDDLYHHYRTYYQPNNAVLTLAGDFESEQMVERIQDLYAGLPSGPDAPHLKRAEPPQTGERRLIVEGPGETTYVQLSYRAPAGSDPDFFIFTLLDSLLTVWQSEYVGGGFNKTSPRTRYWSSEVTGGEHLAGLSATVDPHLYNIKSLSTRRRRLSNLVVWKMKLPVCRTPTAGGRTGGGYARHFSPMQ